MISSGPAGQTTRIGGREIFISALSIDVPEADYREIDMLVTTRGRDHLVCLVFVAPADVFVDFQGAFERSRRCR